MRDAEQVLDELRRLRRKGVAEDTAYVSQNSDLPPWILSQKLEQRRLKRAEEAAKLATGQLLELSSRRQRMAAGIPGKGVREAARTIAEFRRPYIKDLPDPTVLARTPLPDLVRMAAEATEPAVVNDLLREVSFRAEQGNAAAEGDARRIALRLDEVTLELKDVSGASSNTRSIRWTPSRRRWALVARPGARCFGSRWTWA